MLARVFCSLFVIGALQLGCALPGGPAVRPVPGTSDRPPGTSDRPPGTPGTPGGDVAGSPETRAVIRKRVASKRELYTLVAEDGTTCQVSADRFRDVKVGDVEVCLWH